MLLNEILKYADKLIFLLRAKLDNTLTQAYSFDDALSGREPLCGHDYTIRYATNADVKISSDSVPGEQTSHLIAGGFSKQTSYPAENVGVSISKTFGHMFLATVDGVDDIARRKFKGAPMSIEVGGLIHKGKPNEVELQASEYQPWIVGKFGSYTIDEERVDLSIAMDSGELQAKFPTKVYADGISEGLAVPYMFGPVKGYKFPRIRAGFGQFHGGSKVDTNDLVADEIQFSFTGYGLNFYPDIAFEDGFTRDTSGYVSYDRDDHAFVLNGNDKADFSGVIDGSITANGDGARLVVNGNSVTLFQDAAANNRTFTSGDFTWKKQSETQLKTVGEQEVVATLTGALSIEQVGGRYFKVFDNSGASAGGTIELNFGGLVGPLQLVVRQQDLTGVGGWSVTPDAIYLQDGSTENWIIEFADLGGEVLAFDYARAFPSDLIAIWIRSALIYNANPVEITIEFSREVGYLALGAFANRGTIGYSNFSVAPDLVPSVGKEILVFSDVAATQLKFTVLAGFGSVEFFFDEIREEEAFYGAKRSGENIWLRPPPISQATFEGAETGVFFLMKGDRDLPPAINFIFGRTFIIKAKARLVASSIDSAKVLVGVPPIGYEVVNIGPDWKEFEVLASITPNGVATKIGVSTWRGNLTTKSGTLSVNNPDVDFYIDIEFLSARPAEKDRSIMSVYDNASTDYQRLLTYRVTDASQFSGLPEGLALYDDNGFVAYSESYNDLVGDFVGYKAEPNAIEAFREISLLSRGEDLITCDFAGEKVGFVVDQQADWINHVASVCAGLDYVISENDTVQGVTITRRWRLSDSADDFALTADDLKDGVLTLTDGLPREYRYVIGYAPDLSNSQRTKTAKSAFGFTGDLPERYIPTYYIDEADAENRARDIERDSAYNDLADFALVGVGHGIVTGMVGTIAHKNAPLYSRFKIIDVDESSERETFFRAKVYRR